jgi:hypothetical protein
MLGAVYAGIGPHKSTRGMVGGLYLLRDMSTRRGQHKSSNISYQKLEHVNREVRVVKIV